MWDQRHDREQHFCFLPGFTPVDREGRSTSIYDKRDDFNLHIIVWVYYCFTLYQLLWLYNGAPLVAFYGTLGTLWGYGGRILDLNPRRPHGGNLHIINVTFMSSNIPAAPAYGVFISYTICPGLLLVWMFYSQGEASRTGIRQLTLEIVIEEVLWSIRGSYQTIWSSSLTNVKRHSVAWQPSIDQTLYQTMTLLPNSTFHRIMKGFHRTFATGVACR